MSGGPGTASAAGSARGTAADDANERAVARLTGSRPVLETVARAGDVVPGLTDRTILVSGPPMAWDRYTGGQRRAIIGGALYEGLAGDEAEAEALLADGFLTVRPSHDHATVGSLTGVCTASMPVLVVHDQASGRRAFCRMNEGADRASLTFGVWDDGVEARLRHVSDIVSPALAEVLERMGGLAVGPIVRRALTMGDDLHSRHKAAGALFRAEVLDAVLDLSRQGVTRRYRALAGYLRSAEYLFLHIVMAAAKAAADSASHVAGSSLVTAMNLNEKEFGLRVSGLGDRWLTAPLPPVATLRGRLYDGWSTDDLAYVGGESLITETIGLGGMAAAAAMPLQDHSAGSPPEMLRTTERMYRITLREHPDYRIPALAYRGVPCGIDVRRVAETGVVPAIHLGATLRDGGHAGAVLFRPPLEPFERAVELLSNEPTLTPARPGDPL
ncbi:DUF1116 domain-containing protein [Streptomyces griseoviridis]|uniref:DUF1116 domain-containing protein n=1 Tax=Streptomyces hintoniae TaxID=3075521 RepID=A0ABU2UGK9_9ACTN|nr:MULTISPECIES: DUF1116 domain-containing protein [unclassified Streptomyces]MDH6697736.1 hypothetical protein [Streptomyces sp. MAA16]MDT0472398.1 DUF1116 domain-containing protein [Streptomyces sp. DSM 41014]